MDIEMCEADESPKVKDNREINGDYRECKETIQLIEALIFSKTSIDTDEESSPTGLQHYNINFIKLEQSLTQYERKIK